VALMKKRWVLTQEAFDGLLGWLDADRDCAGRKYEQIRLKLVKIFVCGGCSEAEDLADETINRVASKVPSLASTYSGDREPYFYAVSYNVEREYRRKTSRAGTLAAVEIAGNGNGAIRDANEAERRSSCLERCLAEMQPKSRDLVLRYYQNHKREKIEHRKQVALEMGIAPNALRIRVCRIRGSLEGCVRQCLERSRGH
jgi:DNA-directed RNA polymerase specialized sigma24 family protein